MKVLKIVYLRNVRTDAEAKMPVVSKETLWHAHIVWLLTTQQSSGIGSPVYTFLERQPFPLSWDNCGQYVDKALQRKFAYGELEKHKGIGRLDVICDALVENFDRLDNTAWDTLFEYAERLLEQRRQEPCPSHYILETKASTFVDKLFFQIGPKQSRNFWQYLGLSRYLFVLDSRVQTWVNRELKVENESEYVTNGFWNGSLSDLNYYLFLSEILGKLCRDAGVLPCMFDAAVFDEKDDKAPSKSN